MKLSVTHIWSILSCVLYNNLMYLLSSGQKKKKKAGFKKEETGYETFQGTLNFIGYKTKNVILVEYFLEFRFFGLEATKF